MTYQADRQPPMIAVVIPSYRVKAHILSVLSHIGDECQLIYIVDDKCPEGSGQYVLDHCTDPRVRVLFHEVNQGVGGAVLSGYRQAVEDGATVIVKLDGDGQMEPSWIPALVTEIVAGEADYAKGDRFYDRESIGGMPKMRVFGNAALSFLSKISSGYWDIVDPTNGFTAIHATVAAALPTAKISRRYFFESDMLFRLGCMRARVVDIPMPSIYGDEVSGLSIGKVVGEFARKHFVNTFKRVMYMYFVQSFSIASIELIFGLLMFLFGVTFGVTTWIQNAMQGHETLSGTVMVAALPAILGFQILLAFVSADISSVPTRAIGERLGLIRPRSPSRTAPVGIARMVVIGRGEAPTATGSRGPASR